MPDNPPPAALLIDPRAAAALLAISARTLWALTAPRGPIPAVRVGRLVRYRPDDLAAWVQAAAAADPGGQR